MTGHQLLIPTISILISPSYNVTMEVPLFKAIKATSSLSVRRSTRCATCRNLHTTSAKEATPLPHPTVPGPPPEAPQAAPTSPQDRVERKRRQAEALRISQEGKANAAKPEKVLSKRFWKNVSVKEVDDSLQIHLDTRPVRTAARQVLQVPKDKRALAGGIALEWDQLTSAQQAMKQHNIPLTSLTSRAYDIQGSDRQYGLDKSTRQGIVRMAMKYLSTDTLLCWAPAKNPYGYDRPDVKPLRQRQREVAEPIIAYLTTHIFPGIEIVPILGEDSIMPVSQPEMTRQVIQGWVSGLPAFELAALERGILATKSLLVAARLMVEWSTEFGHLRDRQIAASDDGTVEIETERFSIDKAAEAATLEVLYQTEQWGEVEDTHDVDKEDLRSQLGSMILLVS